MSEDLLFMLDRSVSVRIVCID